MNLKKYFDLVFVVCVILLFSSCTNFITTSQVDEGEIEYAIKIVEIEMLWLAMICYQPP